nr:PorT family protein [Bacteroidales bacterium]
MKRIVIIALALLIGASARSQGTTKLLESNFMIGAGLFGETGNRARDVFPGAVLRLSYGLDVRIGENWSVMPGAGLRTQHGNVNMLGALGADFDDMSMADVFCQARYHFEADGIAMVVYAGPQFSYMVSNDRYYIDADPSDPRNGKEKFKTWDIALQPGIIFRSGKHWQWGFEASVGLRNMRRQYPEY